mmetsp:Transcript_25652/g.71710  ORF Transcript_25652/g.71710 Transcript_25652/m.71710 type:complete len:278 (-) Transcript_25652:917-1750(-)
MHSWRTSMRGLAVDSLTTLVKKMAPCRAAVSAPKVCLIGTTSLSMVLGMPTTVTLPPCFSNKYLERTAAWVLVSSPPMVWTTLTSSASNVWDATSRGVPPSLTYPRLMQSATLVSWQIIDERGSKGGSLLGVAIFKQGTRKRTGQLLRVHVCVCVCMRIYVNTARQTQNDQHADGCPSSTIGSRRIDGHHASRCQFIHIFIHPLLHSFVQAPIVLPLAHPSPNHLSQLASVAFWGRTFTREFPIGDPPIMSSASMEAHSASGTMKESPVSNPRYPSL